MSVAAAVIQRYALRDEFCVQVSVSNRGGVAGNTPCQLSDTVPLLVDSSRDTSLAELTARLGGTFASAEDHLRYGMSDIRRDAGRQPDADGNPFGPVVNVMSFFGAMRMTGGTADLQLYSAGNSGDLSIVFYYEKRSDRGGYLRLEGDARLYTDDDLDTYLGSLVRYLRRAVAAPDTPIGTVDLLGADRGLVVERWNDTAVPIDTEATLVSMFAERVRRDPDAVAIVSGDANLTYRQLDELANHLARELISRGVSADRPVAVALPRSPELIVGMLAVLKAGGAYLPIDPAYPADRLAFVLRDAAPVAVVTDRAISNSLPDKGIPHILIEEIGLETDGEQPRLMPSPGNLAYLIYTSGSTGAPKGVAVTHRNVASLFLSTARWCEFGPHDIWAWCHSQAFDFSVWEIWGALLHGGRVVVVPWDVVRTPAQLWDMIVAEGVTILNQTPSAFPALAQARNAESALRMVIFGGEVLKDAHLQPWYESGPSESPVLVNMYGITETTVHVTRLDLSTVPFPHGGSPIGAPLGNMRVYVLDAGLTPVPVGVAGELYVAGAQVARGYHGRAALTAARFVADPFDPSGGGRLYRTGDVARWTREGILEFAGRADDQVQIRGYRVEPGEVESILAQHPSVTQAVVVARGELLVGYVVTVRDRPVDGAQVRRFAAERLPEFMVPAAVTVLESMPLTTNGKVDRRALPDPEFASSAAYWAPTGARERLLAELFGEVLGRDRVGMDDNFFELGGHSLSATRLIGRIRVVLGVEVPIRTVFDAPTVSQLVSHLDSGTRMRPALSARPRPQPIPLSFAQRRLWFIHRLEGPSATYNVPLTARLTGEFDTAAFTAAVGDVLARHESLRTVFAEFDGVPAQRVLEAAAIDIPVTEVDPARADAAVAAAVAHRFDLSDRIPMRAEVFRCGDEWILVLLIHHIAADGLSAAVLSRDLSVAYAARLAGVAPDWTPLPVQYADYTLWQRELLGSHDDPDSVLARQLEYWRHELDGLPEHPCLPTDRPRPRTPAYRGDMVLFGIDADLRGAVEALAVREGATVSMVLQSALAVLLFKLGAGQDIPIGSPIAGRTDEALADLVGCFVNTWVLRAAVSAGATLADVLEQVRAKALAAYENQDAPFELLVELLNPVRSAAHHPLFQIMLSFQDNTLATLEFPGAEATPLPLAGATSRFDLTFNVGGAPGASGWEGFVEYATELFDRSTVEAMAQRLVRVLRQLVRDPRTPVAMVDLLGPEERDRVLRRWNDTAAEVPDSTVAGLFRDQAARTPEATAVVCDGATVSYRELDARAEALAGVLNSRGVGPETVVAVALPRSLELIVALLAVWKAGGAYLPIDPAYPSDRVRYVLDDAAPATVVSDTATANALPDNAIPRLYLDRLDVVGTGERAAAVRGQQLAYVMYTSGSTGTPKGVAITQRNVLNRCARPGRSAPATGCSCTPRSRSTPRPTRSGWP